MCGIVGFSGYVKEGQWAETHRLLEALLLAAEHRGRDATGFVGATEPFKGKGNRSIVIDKKPIPATDFIRKSTAWRGLRHHRATMVVGHVRFATHGSPFAQDNVNNHPLFVEGKLYLVMNGVINNHEDIAARYNLRLTSECDSEVVLRLAEAFPHPAIGLEIALRECDGSMANALYDVQMDTVWLARNGGKPLVVARLVNDGRVFFASTTDIIREGFAKVMDDAHPQWELLVPLAAGRVHALTPDGRLTIHEGNGFERYLATEGQIPSGSYSE